MGEVTAALITGREALEYRGFPRTPPPEGCVSVEISLCGICGTDVASWRTGHLHSPAVCGHEWVGVLGAVGPGVAGLAEGDRVVVAVPPACGRCPECRTGLAEHCRTTSAVARGRSELAPPHGGFAPSLTVEAGRVVPAHPDLRDEEAAQVEPAAVALHGVRRSRITPGDTVVVQGAGPIGLLALQFARAAGAGEVLVVEPAGARRRLALELGASAAVLPEEAPDTVRERTRGLGADVVLECAGVPALLQTAADLARTGGVVGLLSFLSRPAAVDGARWLARELTLVASNAFTHEDVRRSMAFLADGRVRVAPLHSRTVALDDLEPALRALAAGTSDDVKVLVDPRPRSR
ncbi:zinc-dependent alcohol dehydrogenase [Trujillonella humicola]|uniref:zinc-dependent alcohol dehydrogenase n=1 Tax=Trujillonella humicola TaxID=3383699 RepID=UPI003905E443